MDRLDCNRNFDCFVGSGIASEFVAGYVMEVLQSEAKTNPSVRVTIVSDRQVSGYYYNSFENQFVLRNIRPHLITIDASDNSKSLKTIAEIISDFTEFDLGRNDCIIALGGGGVIDCASFAATVYTGNSGFIAVPTTMGSMIESSVALKSYVNSGKHKNAASVHTSTNAVFVDPLFLNTVPGKYRSNGYAQIIRYGILSDPRLLSDITGLDSIDPSQIREFLNKVYAARTAVERKNPLLLTIGDEIATAIEGYFRFMNYSEGEALSLSLYASMPEKLRNAIKPLYSKLGLPLSLEGVSESMILKALQEQNNRIKDDLINVVDFDEDSSGRYSWVVRNIDKSEAMDIFRARLKIICP